MSETDLGDEVWIADVTVDEGEAFVPDEVGEVVHVPRVRESVEGDDLVGRGREQMAHEVRGDEPGAAGDENALWSHSSSDSIV